MKVAIPLLALMAMSASAHSQPDDQLRQELQLKVADAYSGCAAYYEISASARAATNGVGADEAREMKEETLAMAVALATEYEGEEQAGIVADAGYANAIRDMHHQITSDPEAFREWAENQRKSCRMAVNDPPTFVEAFLRVHAGKKRTRSFFTFPKNLTVQDILKNGKRSTGTRQVSKCDDGKDVNIPLDTVLVDGRMVCAEQQGDVCRSERSWMSYSQYIQSLYPGREFDGHVFTQSVTYKKGVREDKQTLVACLLLPETST